MFDELKGIAEARITAPRTAAPLEKIHAAQEQLLPLLKNIVTYSRERFHHVNGEEDVISDRRTSLDALLNPLRDSVAAHLRDIAMTPNDIRDYLIAEQFCEVPSLAFKEKDDWLLARGIFSGILLSVMTAQQQAAGNAAPVHVDAEQGIEYLFAFARSLDEVVIQGVDKEGILFAAASYGGTAKRLMVKDCTGDKCGMFLASMGGSAGTVVFNNVTGTYLATDAAKNRSRIARLIFKDCCSDKDKKRSYRDDYDCEVPYSIAQYIGMCDSSIGLVWAEGIIGADAFSVLCGMGGTAGSVMLKDIRGKDACHGLGYKGNIGELSTINIRGYGKDLLKQVHAGVIHTGERAWQRYRELKAEYAIDDALDDALFAKSLNSPASSHPVGGNSP